MTVTHVYSEGRVVYKPAKMAGWEDTSNMNWIDHCPHRITGKGRNTAYLPRLEPDEEKQPRKHVNQTVLALSKVYGIHKSILVKQANDNGIHIDYRKSKINKEIATALLNLNGLDATGCTLREIFEGYAIRR